MANISERPPARQRKSADARRGEIIEAATELVADLGYARATLTEITHRAGVSKGLLWHYFADRDDLMEQTVTHLAGQLRAHLVDQLDVSAPVPEVIRAVFTQTALFTRTHRRELEALDQIVTNLRAPDGRRRVTVAHYEGIYAEHAELLARGQREGTVRSADVRMLAVGYQALIDGLIGHLRAHPTTDPRVQADAMADVFLLATEKRTETTGHHHDAPRE